ncbi:MFS transporter [Acidocella sp.]|uniref:MFS transporter n=1 Tax=Acidocella sp. TaxID=50710 RepID=UPI003D092D44
MSQTIAAPERGAGTAGPVLAAISLCHMLNDLLQSLLPAVYPILKGGFNLNFGQIGALTLTYQITASLLQPLVGLFTDNKPLPFSLPFGMGFTLAGLVTLAFAPSYGLLVLGAGLLGIGSSVFHPEASRIARLASGGRHGLAQSVFQVGGNFGQALGPLMAAFVVLPHGRASIAWFAVVAFGAIAILSALGRWYQAQGHAKRAPRRAAAEALPRGRLILALSVLLALMFSKFFYIASFTSYYIFYLMQRFHLDVQAAQLHLFAFMAAAAIGTVAGGPIGDRIGRKAVIWVSILGVAPFALVLPYAGLHLTVVLTVIIGLVLSSAFSSIVVYATELMPGRVGAVSGLFFGLAFGMGGIGAAVLGAMADRYGIAEVYKLCSFLPLIGLLAAFLPPMASARRA